MASAILRYTGFAEPSPSTQTDTLVGRPATGRFRLNSRPVELEVKAYVTLSAAAPPCRVVVVASDADPPPSGATLNPVVASSEATVDLEPPFGSATPADVAPSRDSATRRRAA